MLISCNICRDKIISTHDVIITSNCGHLYHRTCFEPWIKANPTCPTCRSRQKTKAIKVFFTTEDDTSESPDAVIERLEEQTEQMKLKYGEMEKELSTVREENRLCTERLTGLESEVYLKTAKISHLSAAAKNLKAEVKRLNEENTLLERSARESTCLQRLRVVLEGTHDEVTEMLKNTSCDYNSVQTLCTFVAQLKKCNLREKEKVQELRKAKKEMLDEIRDLNRRVEDLESRLEGCDENSHPMRIEPKPTEKEEYIDLDEPYESSLEKAFGVDRQLKVLDQRKFEPRSDNSKIFSKASKFQNPGQSNSFEFDGFGGSKRFWPSDLSSKPYQRPISSKNKQLFKTKLKGQQPSLKDFFVNKD